ncbi:PREDICTED: transmembrane protein 139 [Elephantulus edwardii]|uniref:transmembrane protein 139 n=1 Tax=Elephantulus edwardii TaxID=28737 RepID=UPI0003F06EAF|nr:PREDICTED: transmembrane protein 139 [Elephantulus edwardii]
MVPSHLWAHLKKSLLYLSCFSFLLGLALLSTGPSVVPASYFFIALSCFLVFVRLLDALLRRGCPEAPAQSPGTSENARDNEAFEVPSYEVAVQLEPPPSPQTQEDPPPYSTVIALGLEGQPGHTEALRRGAPRRGALRRRGASEGSLTQEGSSRRLRVGLPRAASTEPDLQNLEMTTRMEPLTPPPTYEVDFGHRVEDSVFYQDNWAPP